MISRREIIFALVAGAAAWPFAARSQQTGKMYRIGYLGNSTAALEADLVGPFRDGLRDLGYEEGRNVVIEYRWAEGNEERFPVLIAELIAQKVDVIVTYGTPAALAVKKATTSVPLVMTAVGDPVGTGLVTSLARPGGNITGLSSIAPELNGKRLELLREVIPKLSHIGVFWNPSNPIHVIDLKEVSIAAQVLQMKVQPLGVRVPEELEAAFAAIVKERPDALFILWDSVFQQNLMRIIDFATQNRLPAVSGRREWVAAGSLMSYGPSYEDMHRRAANYVDKILKGAKPADLPIQQPTKFDLVINLKTAKALGVTIPPLLLGTADEVLE
jgi:putative tryptophan/tyrosine transport system substrate-binding protein